MVWHSSGPTPFEIFAWFHSLIAIKIYRALLSRAAVARGDEAKGADAVISAKVALHRQPADCRRVDMPRVTTGNTMSGSVVAKESLERFVRDGVSTYWHVTSTAKMGRDAISAVDGDLKVYGAVRDHRRACGGLIREEHQIALPALQHQ